MNARARRLARGAVALVVSALTLTACVDRYAQAWTPMDNDPNIESWSQNEAVHVVDARVFRDPTIWGMPTGCGHLCVAVAVDTLLPMGTEVPLVISADQGHYRTMGVVVERGDREIRILADHGPRVSGLVDIGVLITARSPSALNIPVIQTDPDAPSPAGILTAVVLGIVGAAILRWTWLARHGLIDVAARIHAPLGGGISRAARREGHRVTAKWWDDAAGMVLLGAIFALFLTPPPLIIVIGGAFIAVAIILGVVGAIAGRRAARRTVEAIDARDS